MDDPHYTLWIKSKCPYCVMAKDELFARCLNYTLYIMDDKEEHLGTIKKVFNHSTVPIITVQKLNEEHLIGGYTDLMDWFKNEDDKQLEEHE